MTTLAQYSAARAALAEASRVEQVMHVRDEVEHLKLYARQIKDRSLMADALELQLRCERRLGELLVAAKELGQIAEGRRRKNSDSDAEFPRVVLTEVGIDHRLSSKAQKAASLSQQAFDSMVEQARNRLVSGAAIIVDMAKAEDKKGRRDEKEAALAERIRAASANVGNGKLYGLILADPAWRFEPYSRETGMDRAPENHYPTMTLDKIEALQIPAADDCVLFLWATVPMLPEALAVMGAWGFTYKSQIVWVKDRIGTGYWARNKHELLLIGTKGSIPAPVPGTQPESAILAPVGRHSEKPEVFHELIERLFPNIPKLEMFSRRARPGWDSWGAEADLPPHDEDGVIIDDVPAIGPATAPAPGAGGMSAKGDDISLADLRDMLDYSPETGEFRWKVAKGRMQPGDTTGSDNGNGYLIIWIDGQRYRAHRLAWLYHYGQWPVADIDHVNGDPTDNRIENLRECTDRENSRNRGPWKRNQSGLKGVHAQNGKWRAQITADGEKIDLGTFSSREEAHAAYREAARKYHGDFARTAASPIKSNAKATEVEPGNAGGAAPVRHNNDWAGVASRLAGGRTPDSEEGGSCALGASPSSQVLDEPSGADPGSAVECGAQDSEVAAVAPASAAIAPVEQSPPFDNAPGAPHSGEMPDIPAIFDRREKAA